jgi:hypothetical protein
MLYRIFIDKVCQWLATGTDSFTPGNPVSSTNKTDRNDIAELVLKVALNTITLTLIFLQFWWVIRFISHLFDITHITINLLHLANKTQICNPRVGRTELYDKTDDFNFPIVNFPFILRTLPVVTANRYSCCVIASSLLHHFYWWSLNFFSYHAKQSSINHNNELNSVQRN